MLVQFSVENFLSFKETAILSMVGYMPIKEYEEGEQTNIFHAPGDRIKLLKSGVLYGANGSGKSNVIAAMGFFKNFIENSSSKRQAEDKIDVLRFLLSSETQDKPSGFEIIFYLGNTRFRYGFEVDEEKVHGEWLFVLRPEARTEAKLFTREFQSISCSLKHFKEGRGLEHNTRSNALFLSTVAQLNGELANQLLKWFKNDLIILSGLDDEKLVGKTIEKIKQEAKFKRQLVHFFKTIRIGFEDIELVEEEDLLDSLLNIPENIPIEIQDVLKDLQDLQSKIKKMQSSKVESAAISINFLHKKFDAAQNVVDLVILDFGLQSKGTQKLFNIFGWLFDAIERGKTLVIDELDSSLHTLLTMELIQFFHSEANKQAQLIFTSHDTNLLRKEIFRRDQIWFAEKNNLGASTLYSLVEYKINQATVRNDASFEKDYLLGKYGAIPFLGDLKQFKRDFLYEQKREEV
jgi:AAA15 family ATPase/GTPase